MARAVVTGGSGFIGSHLVDKMLSDGWEVIAYDNLSTGAKSNVDHLSGNPAFEFVEQDVCEPLVVAGPLDAVVHLASPASPPEYQQRALETMQVNSVGTKQVLDLAKSKNARVLVASTSEVYGDPLVHPQPESYWGHANSVGPRSMYDEAKRFSEAMSMVYARDGLDVKLARIFNTYGPRLRPADGRVISNFLNQALENKPLTVYGDGSQTRSFCFVSDQVSGLYKLLMSEYSGPMNIGNPHEFSILDLVGAVQEVVGHECPVLLQPLPGDDPKQRKPDISLAKEVLGWEPEIELREGLALTADWYRSEAKKASRSL